MDDMRSMQSQEKGGQGGETFTPNQCKVRTVSGKLMNFSPPAAGHCPHLGECTAALPEVVELCTERRVSDTSKDLHTQVPAQSPPLPQVI